MRLHRHTPLCVARLRRFTPELRGSLGQLLTGHRFPLSPSPSCILYSLFFSFSGTDLFAFLLFVQTPFRLHPGSRRELFYLPARSFRSVFQFAQKFTCRLLLHPSVVYPRLISSRGICLSPVLPSVYLSILAVGPGCLSICLVGLATRRIRKVALPFCIFLHTPCAHCI